MITEVKFCNGLLSKEEEPLLFQGRARYFMEGNRGGLEVIVSACGSHADLLLLSLC